MISPFKSYQTPIKKSENTSLFEMVEVPENNRNGTQNKYKKNLDFSLPYEGYNAEPLAKQSEADNYKSRLLGSIEKRATNTKKGRQLGYRDPEEIVRDVHSPQRALSKRAR